MNTNEIEKNKKKFKIAFLIIFAIAIISLIGFAYARYITRLNGTTTADIAKWSLKINGSTNQNFVIDLAQTRTGVTQEAEVEGNYIAPGTAGAFEIELDATGSEASLEYDINLNVNYANNTAFPKNLIFYSDSTMQNALYHDESGIDLNGFIGWDDNSQVQSKTIYWKWDYETGSTQNEIDNNDELDSYWINRPISVSMNVTAKQVSENPTAEQYAVTFDANGGTLQEYGNASQTTKMVTYGEKYGTLPTPTREGYEFKGWNGKNKLNFKEWLRTCWVYRGIMEKGDNNILISATADDAYTATYGENYKYKIPIYASTMYTLSWQSDNNISGRVFVFNNNLAQTGYSVSVNQKDTKQITFNTTSNAEYITFRLGVSYEGESINYSKLMLEEGSTATAYEPYYITSSTEVVQNQNHTLTAIWEPISNP